MDSLGGCDTGLHLKKSSDKPREYTVHSLEAPKVTFPVCFSTDEQASVLFLTFHWSCSLSVLLWKLGLAWYCLLQGVAALTIPGGMRSRASGGCLLQLSFLHRMAVDQHGFLFTEGLFCTLGKHVQRPDYFCGPNPSV